MTDKLTFDIKSLTLALKIGQFVCYVLILVFDSLSISTSQSLNQWIVNIFLICISILIFASIFTDKVYKLFPYMYVGVKLGLLVFIMASFSFGTTIYYLRSFLSFGLLGYSVFYMAFSMFRIKEEKIEDIVIPGGSGRNYGGNSEIGIQNEENYGSEKMRESQVEKDNLF